MQTSMATIYDLLLTFSWLLSSYHERSKSIIFTILSMGVHNDCCQTMVIYIKVDLIQKSSEDHKSAVGSQQNSQFFKLLTSSRADGRCALSACQQFLISSV